MIRNLNAWTAVPVYKFSTLPSELDITPVTRADIGRLMIRWVNSHEPAVQRELLKLWASQGKNITVSQIELMVRRGTIPDEVISGIADSYRKVMDEMLLPQLTQTADYIGANYIEGMGLVYESEKILGPELAQALYGRTEKLAVEMSEKQALALGDWLKQYTTVDPVPSGALAQRVRSMIGLTKRENDYVEAYRKRLLDADKVSPAQVDKLTGHYSRKLRVARAQRIARTEMSFAANASRENALDQAISQGLVDAGSLWQKWSTNGVEVCPICAPLEDGQWYPRGDSQVPWGTQQPPLHPHCGCVIVDGINKGDAAKPGKPEPVKPVAEGWKPVSTVAEAEEQARKLGIDADFTGIASVDGINEAMAKVDNVMRNNKFVRDNLDAVMTYENAPGFVRHNGADAWGITVNSPRKSGMTIFLNNKIENGIMLGEGTPMYAKMGFCYGDGSVASCMTHEMGHVAGISAAGSEGALARAVRNATKVSGITTKQINDSLSYYATYNEQELFAEYFLMMDNPAAFEGMSDYYRRKWVKFGKVLGEEIGEGLF